MVTELLHLRKIKRREYSAVIMKGYSQKGVALLNFLLSKKQYADSVGMLPRTAQVEVKHGLTRSISIPILAQSDRPTEESV